ncbi:hypothetical protein [Saccharothrix obliqua]|uniref:hypothetical protein n=1 Tax=Saccharothrix obliqua TaxID=2861747 RepID=UPI001C5CF0D2|nr:hypothetical protein [Saccharothrix obliqua]MBW4717026.1 hypothetical protein [Saccharothrix obliqua]
MRNAMKATLLAAAMGVALVGCTTVDAPQAATTAVTTTAVTTTAVTTTSAVEPATPETRDVREPAPVAEPVAPVGRVLDRGGFGAIRFGMSAEQLVATGLTSGTDGPTGGECDLYRLRSGEGGVWVAKNSGVASIILEGDGRTEDGVGIGSTEAEVRAAYPTLRDGINWDAVYFDGTAYGFLNYPVTSVLVFQAGQPCHN